MYDVAIVGAGPVGLYSAMLLERDDLKVIILEEHGKIGKPVQCSGLVSSNIEDFVKINKDFVEHRVKGAVLHSPFGTRIKVQKKETAAYVIDREAFDRHLADMSLSEIRLNTSVSKISFMRDRAVLRTSGESIEAHAVLGCDGPNSIVAKSICSKPKQLLSGITATTNEKNSSEFVDIYINKKLALEGFLWKIPRGDTTEYGMWSQKCSFGTLEKFFKISNYSKGGGTIPLGPGRTYAERTLLVGDSAAQVKPWSGGGIVYGLACSCLASYALSRCFRRGDFSESQLSEYEKWWKNHIGRRIRSGMIMRKRFEKMGNKRIEATFKMLKMLEGTTLNTLDMDFLLKKRILFKRA